MMSMLVFVAVGHIVCGRAAASPPSVPCVLAAMGGWHLALSRAGRRRGSVGVQAEGGGLPVCAGGGRLWKGMRRPIRLAIRYPRSIRTTHLS